MRVLLIEADLKLNETVTNILKEEGYTVDAALEGEHGLDLAYLKIYDLMIMDWMFPLSDLNDGAAIIKELRSQGIHTPILLLTGKDRTEDRVRGLDAGADDCLVKPFETAELLARLRALARRREKEFTGNKLVVGGLVFDPLKNAV